MKLKSMIWTLGLRPKPVQYDYQVRQVFLQEDGEISYAKWGHPKDYLEPFKQSVVDEYRQYIRLGDTVIDIGAHTGDITLPMALAAGETGLTIACEPNPYVFSTLEANASLNPGKTNIVPLPFAVGPFNGSMVFQYSDPGYCNGGNLSRTSKWVHGHAYPLSVTCIRLVEWMETKYADRISRISFIKVDAEGCDLEILQSIEPWIADYRPTITAELYHRLPVEGRMALVQYLERFGYRLFYIPHKAPLRPEVPLTKKLVSSGLHFDILAIQDGTIGR